MKTSGGFGEEDDQEGGHGSDDGAVDHTYHDYSNMENREPFARDDYVPMDLAQVVSTEFFPLKLHDLLTIAESKDADKLHETISWAPHGRCLVVHQKEEFADQILPRCFKQTQYASFQRQLNLYGFRRLSAGPDSGGAWISTAVQKQRLEGDDVHCYYHELMLRGKRFLCHHIVRTKIKNQGTRKKNSPETEPRFYDMPFVGDNDSKEAAKSKAEEHDECQLGDGQVSTPAVAASVTTTAAFATLTATAAVDTRVQLSSPMSSTGPRCSIDDSRATVGGTLWPRNTQDIPTPSPVEINAQLRNVVSNSTTSINSSRNISFQVTANQWPALGGSQLMAPLSSNVQSAAPGVPAGFPPEFMIGRMNDENNSSFPNSRLIASLEPTPLAPSWASTSQPLLGPLNSALGPSMVVPQQHPSTDAGNSALLEALAFSVPEIMSSSDGLQRPMPLPCPPNFLASGPSVSGSMLGGELMPLQLLQGCPDGQDQKPIIIGNSTLPQQEAAIPEAPNNNDEQPHSLTGSHPRFRPSQSRG